MMNKQRIYFLGIGGIGMSALARYFHHRGHSVCGYDRSRSDITDALQKQGIAIHFEEKTTDIPSDIDLVIYTPAIQPENRLLCHLRAMDIPVKKRAEVLGEVCRNTKTIAIAGTHGKTTVGCLLTHILIEAGVAAEGIMGGIAVNYSSNHIGTVDAEWMVVEADEYDRSFLHLHPLLAVITAIDADHFDIYGNNEQLQASFSQFASNIHVAGNLLVNDGIASHQGYKGKAMGYGYAGNTLSYGFDPESDYHVTSYRVAGGHYQATFGGKLLLEQVTLRIAGRHNVENALAAAALAHIAGLETEAIRRGIETFRGVKRRFEIVFKQSNIVYIDDYAHHPVELDACIQTARELFPGKKITGVFQPHLYSRTRDLAAEFAESLSRVDELVMLDIYPAREAPIEGISSEWLMNKVNLTNKVVVTKDGLLKELRRGSIEVLLTMGAGDIDKMTTSIKEVLTKTYQR